MSERFTPGPWSVAWTFDVVPSSHVDRAIGAAVDEALDRDHYAQQIAFVPQDRHCRGDRAANARLIAAAPTMADTLLTAKNAIEIAMGELEACLRELNASIRDNEGMTTGREAIAAIDAALAKAKGE